MAIEKNHVQSIPLHMLQEQFRRTDQYMISSVLDNTHYFVMIFFVIISRKCMDLDL